MTLTFEAAIHLPFAQGFCCARFARSVSHLFRALETFKSLGIDFVSFSEHVD